MVRFTLQVVPRQCSHLFSSHNLLSGYSILIFFNHLLGDRSWVRFLFRVTLIFSSCLLAFQPLVIDAQDLQEAARYYQRGRERYVRSNLDGAIADFTTAIELITRPGGARARRQNSWRANDPPEDPTFAAVPYTVVDPHAAQAYAARGLAYLGKKEHGAATADFDQAIRITPRFFEAYLHRGNARFEMRDYIGAIADYDRALRINPELAEAWSNRGSARYQRGDLLGALSDFDRAIALNSQIIAFYYNRGKARRDAGDFAGALTDFDRGIRIDRRSAWGYYGRATVYSDQDKFEKAIANYDRALELDPQLALAYGNRGLMYLRLGEDGRAESDFRRCSLLDPGLGEEIKARVREIKQGRPHKY